MICPRIQLAEPRLKIMYPAILAYCSVNYDTNFWSRVAVKSMNSGARLLGFDYQFYLL